MNGLTPEIEEHLESVRSYNIAALCLTRDSGPHLLLEDSKIFLQGTGKTQKVLPLRV